MLHLPAIVSSVLSEPENGLRHTLATEPRPSMSPAIGSGFALPGGGREFGRQQQADGGNGSATRRAWTSPLQLTRRANGPKLNASRQAGGPKVCISRTIDSPASHGCGMAMSPLLDWEEACCPRIGFSHRFPSAPRADWRYNLQDHVCVPEDDDSKGFFHRQRHLGTRSKDILRWMCWRPSDRSAS